MALKDLKTTRHAVLASVLHLRGQLDSEPVHTARGGDRVGPLPGPEQLQQLGAGDATFALGFVAAGAEVSANVSR